jgi:hypothetical protein
VFSMLSRLRARRTKTVLVGVLGALAGLLVAAPAQADDRAFSDARDDAPARVDIRAVRVSHRVKALRVVVRLDNMRRNRDGSMDSFVVYVDSRRRRTGPEFYASIEGFHWYFGRMRRWRPVRSPDRADPFTSGCRRARADVDVSADKVTFVLPRTRRCIGKIARARVSVVAAHRVRPSGSKIVVDHAPARRRFYGPVRVG